MDRPTSSVPVALGLLLGWAGTVPGCSPSLGHPGGDGVAGGDAAAGGDHAPQGPVVGIAFTVGEAFTIAGGMDHVAFPDVARMADGRLILAYRQGADHADASGRIIKQFADGETPVSWSPPAVLYDEPGVDDRDPSVALLGDGRLLVTYFQYAPKGVASGTVVLHQIFSLTSENNGATFSLPENLTGGPMDLATAELNGDDLWVDDAGAPITVYACSSPALELDGVQSLVRYGGYALNLGNLANAPRSRISLLTRSGEATAWSVQAILPDAWPTVWVQEPSLIRLRDGTLVLHIRTATGTSPSSAGHLAQSTSVDGGVTWAAWSELSLIGHAPYLLQLENGVLLSAVRQLNDAMTHAWTSFVYSLDKAATWSEPVIVEDCGASECGYPSLVELSDNRLLVVYYGSGGSAILGRIVGFEPQLD